MMTKRELEQRGQWHTEQAIRWMNEFNLALKSFTFEEIVKYRGGLPPNAIGNYRVESGRTDIPGLIGACEVFQHYCQNMCEWHMQQKHIISADIELKNFTDV
jgi:hypothetical protein